METYEIDEVYAGKYASETYKSYDHYEVEDMEQVLLLDKDDRIVDVIDCNQLLHQYIEEQLQ